MEPDRAPHVLSHHAELAIETALAVRIVFRLALRQCEGLIGSVMHRLGLDLAVPDHATLSRRVRELKVDAKPHSGTNNLHLIVDSTGLKLRGAGDWLQDKHDSGGKRRSWFKLHIGMGAESGEIVTSDLTDKAVDDAAHVPVLLDQISIPIASFMGDGAFDTGAVHAAVIFRNPDARVIVPPGKDAVLSLNAATAPSQRDRTSQRSRRMAEPNGRRHPGTRADQRSRCRSAAASALSATRCDRAAIRSARPKPE